MDEKHFADHLASRSQNGRARIDGIIGRLTYQPARDSDEEFGELGRNRVKDETPHFKQVTPFGTWCPASKINSCHLNEAAPWRIARAQENWLSEQLPDASIDEQDLEALFLEEIARSQVNSTPSAAETALLFSTGEIIDVRDSYNGVRKHTVLAKASGSSRNILQMISLSCEEWTWNGAGVKVRTHSPNHRLEGEWCEDGVAITLIRFAQDIKKDDPVKWLLVQRGTATTVYEPEVRALPLLPKGFAKKHSRGKANLSQIYANPLFTIPMQKTAGSLQSDVRFSRSEKGAPQLAIIDQCGYWSIWDITESRTGRPKVFTPVLTLCGNSFSGCITKLPSGPSDDQKPHQMILLTLGTKVSNHGSRDQVPTPRSSSPKLEPKPKRILLLSNTKALHLYDTLSETLHPVTHTVLSNDSHQILNIAPSRLDSSHAFILTNTSILWVAVKQVTTKSKSKSKSSPLVSLTLEILVSCLHQKDSTDPTLRLDVSAGTFINNVTACFICIWSAKDTELTIFWFLTPDYGPVRYQRELVSVESPANFVGLSMMPVARMVGGDEAALSTVGKAMREAQLRFFQFLTLGKDLEVRSALCVWSDKAGLEVPPPNEKAVLVEGADERGKLEEELQGAFVVPDEFDERAIFAGSEEEIAVKGERKKSKPRIKNLVILAEQLLDAGEADRDGKEGGNEVGFDFIHETVEQEAMDGYMPNRSLIELAKVARPRGEILELARKYANEQPEPQEYTESWFYTPESTRPIPGFNPDDMAKNISSIFPYPKRCRSAYKRHRKEVTQQMAAEMFLSNIGISSVPRDWVTSQDTPEAQSTSQAQFPSSQSLYSSQLLPPSPTKGSSFSSKQYSSQLGPPSSPTKHSSQQPRAPIPTGLHIRQYVSTSSSNPDPPLDLTPWELGASPEAITWRPGQDLEAEAVINHRRRKIEARRKRNERLSQAIFGEESIVDSGNGPATIQPSSQSLLLFSQQVPGSPSEPGFLLRSPVRKPMGLGGSPLRREYLRDSFGGGGGESRSTQRVGYGGESQSQSQRSNGTQSQSERILLGFGGANKRDWLGVARKRDSISGAGGRDSFGGRLSPFKKSPSKKRKSGGRLSGFR
ncbi:RNA polymerase I-specific transcription-initiation factor-domain-containing protein [Cladorrhinum samala]|uniref:RNA polymerase I-specific transcription-initiation factor-domain-containing protein n=1 Tax=Cladorrhinum samala TaxID=585594 RepID=A0AAV9HGZ8_9PEZI|nr:RNA polymerase I-specific transcription-initiation factor-domain-containing protein [Cladorrhinum samala]